MLDHEYQYRVQTDRVILQAVFYGGGAALFAYLALTNDRGLILYVIPLAKDQATVFYGFFAVTCTLISLGQLLKVNRSESLKQRIAFTKDGFLVPRSAWSKDELVIPYENVIDMKEYTEPDVLTEIRYQGGNFKLRLNLLPDERTYSEVVHSLNERVQAAKSGPPRTVSTTQPSPSLFGPSDGRSSC